MMQRLEELARENHKDPHIVKSLYQRHMSYLNAVYKTLPIEKRRDMAFDAVKHLYEQRKWNFSDIFK